MPVIDVEFANFVFDNGLVELVKQQTRGKNILDLLLVNDLQATYNAAVEATFSTSDHCAIFWQTYFPDVKTEASQLYFDFRCADYAMLAEYLNDVNWLQLFTCVAPYDVEGIWQVIKGVIREAILLYVPQRAKHSHSYKRTHQYPAHIQRAIKRKRALWRSRNHTGKAAYATQARKCKRLVKQYHANRERHLLGSNNLAAFYQHVKSKLGSSRGAVPLIEKGELLLNDDEKANAFN